MDELALLCDVARRLDAARIRYMLTGSLAMSFYAQPRMTRDIDVVVEVERDEALALVRLFQDDYYISAEAVKEAIHHRTIFNAVHLATALKVDFIVRKAQHYRRVEFARRQKIEIGEQEVYVVSKEDLILSKLWWAKDSKSEMQLRDVQNLLSAPYDRPYLENWLRELGLYELARPLLQ